MSYAVVSTPDMVPFAVTARLTEPVVYTRDGIHLDGLLAHAAYLDLDERTRRRMAPISSEFPPDVPLPLAKWAVTMDVRDLGTARLCTRRTAKVLREGTGDVWGWCASAEDAEWLRMGRAEIRKKPELDEIARYSDAETVTTSAGGLKAYDLTLPTVMAHAVRWYGLGAPDHVVSLLRRHVPALGRKRGLGWGTVLDWDVEVIVGEDWSVTKGSGQLMRRMPLAAGFNGRQAFQAIRPPYFHASRFMATTEPAL